MLKKIVFSLLLFYFLALFETSFLSHFSLWGQVPNLLLIALFLIIFFEKKITDYFPVEAVIAGFFSDIFSRRFLGVSVVIFFLASFLLERALKVFKKQNILAFILLFFIFFLFSESALAGVDFLLSRGQLSFSFNFLFLDILYNFIFLSLIYFFLCLILRSPMDLKIKK